VIWGKNVEKFHIILIPSVEEVRKMNEMQELCGIHHSDDLLDRGIVNSSSTVISLLGLDLIGVRQLKVVTTIDTWLNYGGFLC
jgi:hypothetical protein